MALRVAESCPMLQNVGCCTGDHRKLMIRAVPHRISNPLETPVSDTFVVLGVTDYVRGRSDNRRIGAVDDGRRVEKLVHWEPRLTSKMSHDGSGRDSCRDTICIRGLHFEFPSVARGVTDPGVGSGALFGSF